jgi:hypothetical protein
VSKKFGEWYQKTNKTEDTNKLTLLALKIITILHNTLLATFIKLLETVSKGLFRNGSQNCCHTFLDCHHVCKTCAFYDALQAGNRKKFNHRTPLIWCLWAPDQGSMVDFFLFPRLKGTMKGARFADMAAIQERVTGVLRSVPKEAFADSFQKLYERCQQCVVKDGDYFQGQ